MARAARAPPLTCLIAPLVCVVSLLVQGCTGSHNEVKVKVSTSGGGTCLIFDASIEIETTSGAVRLWVPSTASSSGSCTYASTDEPPYIELKWDDEEYILIILFSVNSNTFSINEIKYYEGGTSYVGDVSGIKGAINGQIICPDPEVITLSKQKSTATTSCTNAETTTSSATSTSTSTTTDSNLTTATDSTDTTTTDSTTTDTTTTDSTTTDTTTTDSTTTDTTTTDSTTTDTTTTDSTTTDSTTTDTTTTDTTTTASTSADSTTTTNDSSTTTESTLDVAVKSLKLSIVAQDTKTISKEPSKLRLKFWNLSVTYFEDTDLTVPVEVDGCRYSPDVTIVIVTSAVAAGVLVIVALIVALRVLPS